jgi:uncharacterized SAM-binding protein YcdF (DUF218 family)
MQIFRKLPLKSIQEWAENLGLFLLGVVISSVIMAFILAGQIYDYQDTVNAFHLPEVDVIVCLGGGKGRIAAAGDLWSRYWAQSQQSSAPFRKIPILYFSGMGRQVSWPSLSRQIRREVLQTIRPQDVLVENESSNTQANALWLARYAQERHWQRVLLLTSSYHLKRARFIFDHILNPDTSNPVIQVETLSVFQEPFTMDKWRTDLNGIRVTLLEYIKSVYYRWIWRP